MELFARNALPGEAPELKTGATAARVRLEPAGGAATAGGPIADEAVDGSGPKPGDRAYAVAEEPGAMARKG